jgi:hypothetical protein
MLRRQRPPLPCPRHLPIGEGISVFHLPATGAGRGRRSWRGALVGAAADGVVGAAAGGLVHSAWPACSAARATLTTRLHASDAPIRFRPRAAQEGARGLAGACQCHSGLFDRAREPLLEIVNGDPFGCNRQANHAAHNREHRLHLLEPAIGGRAQHSS